MQDKQVTLINQAGQVTGQADLYAAHRHPAQYHLAVSVWLVRGSAQQKQVLLQKRSLQKIVGANQWGNGICGNVRPGEDFLGCARRRLKEEIGLENLDLKPSYQFEYQVYSNEEYGEHELDQVYLARYGGEFNLNPEEVQEVAWIDLAELKSQVDQQQVVTAEETLGQSTAELKNLTPPLFLKISGQTFEIAPWTAIMLGDQRLWTALNQI